jgi:hypothetical protein
MSSAAAFPATWPNASALELMFISIDVVIILLKYHEDR